MWLHSINAVGSFSTHRGLIIIFLAVLIWELLQSEHGCNPTSPKKDTIDEGTRRKRQGNFPRTEVIEVVLKEERIDAGRGSCSPDCCH
jgi:hypothetical protein